jgi:hypothetical protein
MRQQGKGSSSMIILRHPLLPLVLLTAAVLLLLALPLRLPIGPNYWDLYTYVDTAYRISRGQLPHVDFFVPVGSLGYALYIFTTKIFPAAHTLLAVHYAILIIALPLMAVIVMEAQKRSRAEAMALAIPFAIFALIPINGLELYPSPGFDGYGNYNRHVALLLYVLAANLLFVENKARAVGVAVALLATLFMVKVTGFVVGLLLVVHALLAGRLSLPACLVATSIAMAAFALVEWRTGLISAYVADIIELVGINTGSLLPRILTVLSVKFDVVAVAAALTLLLFWRSRSSLFSDLRLALAERSLPAFRRVVNADWFWLLSLLLAGTMFETQNTGSHEYILIWPAILLALRSLPTPWRKDDALVLILIAATVLPTPISIIHRAARAIASAPGYEALNVPSLGPLGRVSVKPDIMRQSRAMLAHYPSARASYEQFAKRGVLPSYILFSEIDFQVSWLVSVQQAADAIKTYERDNGKYFRRIVTLDFVDPLPVILQRDPLGDMSIGNDPTRTLAKLGAHAIAEIASAEAILLPLCPVTEARNAIAQAYAPSLAGRRLVALTPCFNMLVKD